ncbi:MAG: response regulator [Desulfamplus sp.]|nr:response regulator [Desulfamplus sp.]
MSNNLKILVVDDTIFYRQLLSTLIEEIPDIDLMGVASNGKIALKKIELSEPDLVIMDIVMPEMDGLEALGHIKAKYPNINVIMVSGVDKEGAELTVKALERGALDFIPKPKAASPDAAFAELKSLLNPLIALSKAMKASKEARRIYPVRERELYFKEQVDTTTQVDTPNQVETPTSTNSQTNSQIKIHGFSSKVQSEDTSTNKLLTPLPSPSPISKFKKREIKRIDVVAIGVSTGGPNTLKNIIPRISKDFPVPILTVQHMPPIFTASLAESLNRTSAITVVEAKENQLLESGTMYIAPGGHHIVVRKIEEPQAQATKNSDLKIGSAIRDKSLIKNSSTIQIALVDSPPIHNCRPSVDVLFRSVAMVFGGNVLAVILTGMGHDGLSGVAAIRRKGGYSLAQDEKSSVVWGMPGAVVEANEADEVHSEDQIAERIMELVKKSRL